ncbi:Uncharacterised protein [Mycobacteroides abscessus subsp. massiliense]|uniref:hypothetical protein n=1 Tax=Mycobacteroides abscessus TaxID=36809 RepID=UPI0009A8E5A8|nr:hypothetical protein [Mycobacteroides abscessus]SKH97248.1 Uncharacterised protein [Mycobacteroides abscessus subsp. massiliense]SKM41061.1 Uncharacterised protein [Mycobacteroides abscessus subsp. massiliense]SKR07883.1 Uncharacterised protein [Mycobacteroides abscessus subsp. massiliense]SKR50813.1 Uncharacterised protein [Mycobacteroides abscessus subsp. massiliense]SKU06328.1 Uncharacterised protein [Mycobacteroides abscessus subsp. massiliense]
MRVLAAVLLCAMFLAWGGMHGIDTPRAVADTSSTAATEVPPDSWWSDFEDDPRIVDSHPVTFQTWSRTPSGDAVLVYFTTGTPQCHGVHATVRETDDAIEIALRGGTPPDAVGKMCTMIAIHGSLLVPLENPLAERRVLSVV